MDGDNQSSLLLFPSWEKVRYSVVLVFLGIAKGMRFENSMPFVITKTLLDVEDAFACLPLSYFGFSFYAFSFNLRYLNIVIKLSVIVTPISTVDTNNTPHIVSIIADQSSICTKCFW